MGCGEDGVGKIGGIWDVVLTQVEKSVKELDHVGDHSEQAAMEW